MKSDIEKINDYFDKKIKLIKEEDLKRLDFPTQEIEDGYRELLIQEIEIKRKFSLKEIKRDPSLKDYNKPDLEIELESIKGVFEKDYD